ncbi:MAG: DUF2470 domain-containing protein [Pseudomonadota bacterium]
MSNRSTDKSTPSKAPYVEEAVRLLLGCSSSVLSTLSKKVDGYPFGSIVPYCLDYDGLPLILISDIAEHTRNLDTDPRGSLIMMDGLQGDVQARGRITLIGDIVHSTDIGEDSMTRYYRHFPEARDYHKTHSFRFYKMQVKKIRFIGGFGAIHWIKTDSLISDNPFSFSDESAMIDHMNDDHVDSMHKYLNRDGVEINANTHITMAGVDATGFAIKADDHLHRFWFEEPVDSPMMVRKELVKLSRAC